MTADGGPGAAGVSGIVLAGGRSRRFGSDKLAAVLDGRPILELAIDALRPVCDEIVVVLPPDSGPPLPRGVVAVRDPEPFGGPLVGLAAGLAAAAHPHALVVAGDMPWLKPAVLRLLLDELRAGQDVRVAAAVLGSAEVPERSERFPVALTVPIAILVARRLLETGDRRLARLTDELNVQAVSAERWLALDPSGWTPRDVDRPEDLDRYGPNQRTD